MNEDKGDEPAEISAGTGLTEHMMAVGDGVIEESAEGVGEPSGGPPSIERPETIEQALKGLTETVAGLARGQEIMQGAMRQLAVKVGEAATSKAA